MADEKKIEDKVFKVIEEGVDLAFSFGKRAVTEGLKEILDIKTGDTAKDDIAVEEKVKDVKRKVKLRLRDFVDGLWKEVDANNPKDKIDS